MHSFAAAQPVSATGLGDSNPDAEQLLGMLCCVDLLMLCLAALVKSKHCFCGTDSKSTACKFW